MIIPPRSRFCWRNRALVLALLLIGAGLRLVQWGQVPPGLYHDEAFNGLDALNVLRGEWTLYFTANNGREPLFIYLVTAAVGLLGRTPLAVRLPAFFAGMLTLAATYDLARVLWDRRTARWALGVLSVTFWAIHLSRMGFRAVLLPLFTALFLGQLVRALQSGRRRHWIAAGALYGIAWYTYMAVRFTPVALAAWGAYLWLFQRPTARDAGRRLGPGLAAALLALLPLGLYAAFHPEIVLARTGQVTILSPEINRGDFWGTLWSHTLRTAGMFFVQGDRIWRHNLAWRPVWDPALGVAFGLGALVALARFRRDSGAALALLWTGVMALPTLLAEDAPHFLRAVGVLPSAALLPALGLAWLEGQPLLKKRAVPWGGLLAVALLLWGAGSTIRDYFFTYARAPLAYHWLEGGPEELAGRINARRNVDWDGNRMRPGPARDLELFVDRGLWNTWTALPFLVPESAVSDFPPAGPPAPDREQLYVVWPYGDGPDRVLAQLTHPAYVSILAGPLAQGDLDPEPFTTALLIGRAPRPEVPPPLARFEGGITLRAALVAADRHGARVRLWWDAEQTPSAAYTVYIHYLREGRVLTQHDGPPGYNRFPTPAWQAGDLILDEHPFPGLQPDPARDRLRIGLYRSDTAAPLPRLDSADTWIELPVILDTEP